MEEYTIVKTFVEESGEHDMDLIVDGHKIQVLKAVLSVASPVFRTMLNSDFKEKSQSEIELPDKKYTDFIMFLSCIYPNILEQVTSDSVYGIIPLAVEYQVKVLENRCHKLLTELVKNKHLTDATQIYRHIQLAELYRLEDLRKTCISAASDFELCELDEAASTYPITLETVAQIHRIAHQKQDLNKKDDKFLMRQTDSGKNVNYESIIKKMIESVAYYSDRRIMAARLCYRYFPNDETLLVKVIKNLKSHTESEDFALLPETIKQRFELASVVYPRTDCITIMR